MAEPSGFKHVDFNLKNPISGADFGDGKADKITATQIELACVEFKFNK